MTDAVLITGGAGFIGSNFVEHVRTRMKMLPIVLDRFDGYAVKRPMDFEHVIMHDLQWPMHPLSSAGAALLARVKWVVHMAAGSHVDRSVTDPAGFVRDNVLGTVHLFEFIRSYMDPQKVLYFSTDEVFGPADYGETFSEYSRHEPNNPYAASKSGGEVLCSAYANTYGMPIAVSHCCNVYGPNQHREKFIPLCIERIQRGQTIQIHARDGVPSSRIYLHVDDVCRAVERILLEGDTIRPGADSGRYNIAGPLAYERSNLEVAQLIGHHLGKAARTELVESVPNRPRHDQRYMISWQALWSMGWEPRIPLEIGLRDLCRTALEAA